MTSKRFDSRLYFRVSKSHSSKYITEVDLGNERFCHELNYPATYHPTSYISSFLWIQFLQSTSQFFIWKTSIPPVNISWLCFPSVFFSLFPCLPLLFLFSFLLLLFCLPTPSPAFLSPPPPLFPFLCLSLSSYSPPPSSSSFSSFFTPFSWNCQ